MYDLGANRMMKSGLSPRYLQRLSFLSRAYASARFSLEGLRAVWPGGAASPTGFFRISS